MHLWSPQSGATLLPTSRHDHIVQVPCGVPPAVFACKAKTAELETWTKKYQKKHKCVLCTMRRSHYVTLTKSDPFRSVSIQLAQRQPHQDVPRHKSSASVSVSGTARGAVQLVACHLVFFPFVPCPKRGIDGGWSSRPHWGFPPMVQSIDIIL